MSPDVKAGEQLNYEVADSVWTAPGWRIVGPDFYTCIPPVDRPHDPAFERLVREFDPDAVFLWRKQAYLPPNATRPVTVCHNAIGHYRDNPRRELQLFYVEMPPDAAHPRPNELAYVWEMFDDCLMYGGGPGAYMPWDGRIVDYLRRDYNVMRTSRQIADVLELRRQQKQARRAADAAELRAEWDEFNRWICKQLDKPGDTVAAFLEYRRKAKAKRAPKPRVFVGRTALPN